MRDKKEFAFWLVIALILAVLFQFEIIDETSTGLAIGFLGAIRAFIWQRKENEKLKNR